jgi:hypothetical protein
MKLGFAVLVYLMFAVLLGWGILLAVHRSPGLLMAGAAFYLLLLWRVGCTEPKGH